VLIGCKTDLRKDKEQLRKLRAVQQEPITYMQVGQAPGLTYQSPGTAMPETSQAFVFCNWGVLAAFPGAEASRTLRII
jgi:hypothetical protein